MGSKESGSGNTAVFQMHAWRWALITFSVRASLEGGSEWIGGADPTVYPHLAAQNLYLISDIFRIFCCCEKMI